MLKITSTLPSNVEIYLSSHNCTPIGGYIYISPKHQSYTTPLPENYRMKIGRTLKQNIEIIIKPFNNKFLTASSGPK